MGMIQYLAFLVVEGAVLTCVRDPIPCDGWMSTSITTLEILMDHLHKTSNNYLHLA